MGSGNNFTTPVLSATTTFYVQDSNSCGASTRTAITVTVNPLTAIFSQSTSDQTQCLNGTFTPITITATGGNLVYQWYKNTSASTSGGTAIGTNSSSYTPLATTAGTQYYYCVVSGTCGSNQTSLVSGAFTVNSVVVINNQSTTAQTQCIGGNFTPISISASGSNLTYQWYSNSVASNSGGTSLGVDNGAQTNSYIPQTSIAGTLYYYCVVSGISGDCPSSQTSAISGAFIVYPETAITSQSTVAQSQCLNGTFTPITVTATGGNLVYQWYSNSIASTSGGNIVGTNSYSFIPLATTVGTLYYYCVVSGSCGTMQTSSVSGAFTVNQIAVINSQSTATQTQCIGGTFTPITATATGDNLTYQWYSNTGAFNSGGTSLGAGNGAQTSSYTPQASSVGTLYYYCVVSGLSGDCSSSKTTTISGAFIVNPQTTISSQSTASQSQCLNGTFTPITVTATGANLVYQWYSNTSTNTSGGTIVGTSSNSYTPSTAMAGTLYYYCVVSGSCGNQQTSAISGAFIVNTLINSQSTESQTQCLGGTFNPITVSATGSNLTYQWYSNTSATNSGGSSLGTNNGAQTNSYTPQTSSAGTLFYYCIVGGVNGSCSTNQTTAVSGAFTVNTAPTTTVSGGGTFCNSATLTATTTNPDGNVIVGQGATTSNSIPLNAYYNYSRTTSLILRNEVPSSLQTITHLQVYVGTINSHNFTNIEIRMKSTTAVTTGTNWDGSGTLVWSGNKVFTTTGWVDFDITDFAWTSDNLMITWQWNGNYSGNYPYFYTTTEPTYLQNYYYSDAAFGTTMTQSYPRVNYQLSYSVSSTTYWENVTSNGTSTSSPSTSQTVTTSGTYYFRPLVTNGCWGAQGSAIVTINPAPSQPGAISGNANQCVSQTNQVYSIAAVPYATSYNWTVPTGWTITGGAGTNSITVTTGTLGQNGNITVTATGACGTSTASTLAVNVAIPAAVTVTGGVTQCGGSETLFATGGDGGIIYFEGTTSNGTSTATPSASQTVGSSGIYYFRAQNAGGCWGPQGNTTVTINVVPDLVTVTGAGSYCNSKSIVASGGTNGTIYFQGTTSSGTSTSLGGTPQTITSSGTYYFRAKSTPGCWGQEGSATITIYPTPAAVTVTGAGAFCGSTIITASGGAGGTIYYEGQASNGTSTTNPISSATITTSGTHTFYFRSLSPGGCWGTQGSAVVTINTVPSAVTVTGGGPNCNSKSISASGGTNGTIYFQGTTSGGTSTALGGTPQTVTSSGTYYFRSGSAAGCWGTEGSANVTILSAPGIVSVSGDGNLGENTTQCLNGTFNPIIITATGTNLVYHWYRNTIASNSGGTAVGTNSNSYTPLATSVGSLYYYCVVSGDCGSSQTSVVSRAFVVKPLATISSQSTASQTQCLGGSFNPITVTATGTNLSYQWYSSTTANNSGGISLGSSNGAQTNSYTPQASSAGTLYYYCVVNADCGTPLSSAVSGAIIVNPATFISDQSTLTQTQCLGGTFIPITVSATGTNLSYQWYSNTTANNGGGISLGSNNGAQTNSYTPQAFSTGTLYYYCVVTGTCGTAQTSDVSEAFIVNPTSVGGSLTGTGNIMLGSSTGTMTLSGYTGTILGWEKKLIAGSWIPVSNTIDTYSEVPTEAGVWHYRAIVQSGNCQEVYSDEFEVIVNSEGSKILSIKLYLEGLYAGNGMMIQAKGYSGPQFTDGIADVVRVELHDASSPYAIVYSFGNINLHTDGTLTANLPANISGSYYVVIKHRNSIETWSSNSVDFAGTDPVSYNFTNAAGKAFGNNMKLMSGNIYAIFGGDASQDGGVDGSDMALIDNANIAVQVGYYPEDINGDGLVDGSDMAMIDNNSIAVVFVRRP